MLRLEEIFQLVDSIVDWCAVFKGWHWGMGLFLEFMQKVFNGCIQFVGTGCLRHWEFGWKEDDFLHWNGSLGVWHEDVVLSAVVHCRSDAPALFSSV